MIKELLSDHFDFIDGKIENGLIVYKGFPGSFVKEISNRIPFASKTNPLDINALIDLQKIISKKKDIVIDLWSIQGLKIATFEEFTIFRRLINTSEIDYKILIINNNLFKGWYPNPSNQLFPDIENNIENNENFNPDENFIEFYSNSQLINGFNFISYYDIDDVEYKSIEVSNYFDIFNYSKNIISEIDSITKELIELPSPDKVFLKIKSDFYNNKPLPEYNFLISDLTKTGEIQVIKDELPILSFIANKLGISVNAYSKKEDYKFSTRTEFSDILNQYWNSDSFRSLLFYNEPHISKNKIEISQDQIIEYIVNQSELASNGEKYRDVFITAPTGSGKSLLFQIPAIYLANSKDSVTIVVTPLKALMYDQVTSLNEKGVESACYINSDISYIERQEIIKLLKNGKKSILYLSPELLLSYSISEFIGDRKIGLLVIDEAHLVTTWGRDFRVDYWYLGKHLRSLRKYSNQLFPVLALTATAVYGGNNGVVDQTIESLNMRHPKLFIGNVRRDEIHFEISKFVYDGNHENEKIKNSAKKIETSVKENNKSIFYFPWIRQIELTMHTISPRLIKKTGKYYGNIDQYDRKDVIENFKSNNLISILATKAFGMGVDISDIIQIYHHAPSGNLSDYVQEIGRVARDKKLIGKAIVDFTDKDLKFTKILYGLSSVKPYQVKLVLQKLYSNYALNKKQNMLFSIEDFQFIFPNSNNIEGKVKSTLLLLEDDFYNKYGYYVILVRAKSLYTTVFAEIPTEIESTFIKKYGSFCKIIVKPKLNESMKIKTHTGLTITNTGNKNNFYSIEFDRLWEKHFSDSSFPSVKRSYFERKLFSEEENSNPIPLCKLSIKLSRDVNDVSTLLKYYWDVIIDTLESLTEHFFTQKEFEKSLAINIDNRMLRSRIVDLVLSTYSTIFKPGDSLISQAYEDSFLQRRMQSNIPRYRVSNKRYYSISKNVLTKFSEMFSFKERNYEKYLNPKAKIAQGYIKIAHLIESFNLGSYDFASGMLPRVFVRINDPFKVRMIANNPNYTNEILEDINNRHLSAVETMDYFFSNSLTDLERWDFIEDYFLGKV